ncbi:adenosylcobinamide-GDP ribazoletransferase [Croceicoccus marinus]|uniref:Adenosylcobinamide-GDP ribazoletransferase n=1 Tax=Croceicoccus marinus TaxID=450378 RepID=A0A1Z1FG85_9SPHN|nr:adenosylcobinamide-GDP ribazoletransferase [Croceicoccus marinus]ARU17730.1 adenosylcobinamide-GDP ribazoletransferase [Croceicoccus marinus]
MKPVILALQFMTRLPLPQVRADAADFAAAMRWFPLAGLVVGAAVWAGVWLGALTDPWVGALLGVGAWAAITGALHLDGLGDVADAAGAGHRDPGRVSEVLADPHIGSFGVVVIALQIAAKLVLLFLLAQRDGDWVLPAIACAARIGPLVWTLILPPLHEGLGSRFAAATRWRDVAIWAVLGAIMACFVPALAMAVPVIWLWGPWVRSRLGGISGDSHGAGIETTETALLLAWVTLS